MMIITLALLIAVAVNASSVAVRPRGISRWFPQQQRVDYGKLPVNFHVLTSPALDFAPWLEIHHVVLLGVPGSTKVFAVDYSPLNQQAEGTVGKLIRGKHVPAEIRVRMIDSTSQMDVADIKRQWTCMGGTGAAVPEVEVAEGCGVLSLMQLAAIADQVRLHTNNNRRCCVAFQAQQFAQLLTRHPQPSLTRTGYCRTRACGSCGR